MLVSCFDGAEVCELVGSYIVSKVMVLIKRDNLRLYQDDSLGDFCNLSGAQLGRKQRQIA